MPKIDKIESNEESKEPEDQGILADTLKEPTPTEIIRQIFQLDKKASHYNTTIHQNHGPAKLDRHAAILEGKENCWLAESRDVKQTKRPFLVFSNALINQTNLSEKELLIILPTLIEDYDFYIWSDEKLFSQLTPLSTIDNFLEQRSSIKAATKNDIKMILPRLCRHSHATCL
jgi:hypothetical protein